MDQTKDFLMLMSAVLEELAAPDSNTDSNIHLVFLAASHRLPRGEQTPYYSTSLDAAIQLVPEGCSYTLYGHLGGERENHCDVYRLGELRRVETGPDTGSFHQDKTILGQGEQCSTAAIALCTASLRAMAAEYTAKNET